MLGDIIFNAIKLIFSNKNNSLVNTEATPEPIQEETDAPESEEINPVDVYLKTFSPEKLKKELFKYTPLENIEGNWPLILDALNQRNLMDKDMVCYVLATVFVENAKFSSQAETPSRLSTKNGLPPFDFSAYVGKGGNENLEQASLYRGAGFIQLTLRNNYEFYDKRLNLDGGLVRKGYEAARIPEIAANILAEYIKDREAKLRIAFSEDDYASMRKQVNTGLIHLEDFTNAFKILKSK